MKNTTLKYQSYGSSILLFVEGDSREAVYGKYLHLWNWNATSSEPEWVTDKVISVWSTIERLQVYLFNTCLMRVLGKGGDAKFKGVKGGAKDAALKLAMAEFDAIEQESYRSINGSFVEHEFGTIEAEKPDTDLKDYFILRGFAAA